MRIVYWGLYVLGGLVLALLLVTAGLFGAAWWTRYPGPTESNPEATVIEDGYRYHPSADTVRPNSRLVVTGNRIECLGDTCAAPDGARRINASGQTLLPGLIDLHVHFDAPAGDDLRASLPYVTLMWSYLRHRPDVRRAFLQHGVTSVRSVGDPFGYPFGILRRKAKIAHQQLAGPRLFTTGPIFTAPKGHPAGTIYEGNDWLIRHATRQVTQPDTARARVRGLVAKGVDGIKVAYEGGSQDGGQIPRLDRTVMAAVIEEAHRQGLWVAAHTSTIREMRHVLAAGPVETIEHGAHKNPIPNDLLETMKRQEVTYVPTLAVVESKTQSQSRNHILHQAKENVMRVHEAGIPVAAGTDTQWRQMYFGKSLHRELELLVAAGLPPVEAMKAATQVGARALDRDSTLGRLTPGAQADLVLVRGRPDQEISALRKIRLVMKEGRICALDSDH